MNPSGDCANKKIHGWQRKRINKPQKRLGKQDHSQDRARGKKEEKDEIFLFIFSQKELIAEISF